MPVAGSYAFTTPCMRERLSLDDDIGPDATNAERTRRAIGVACRAGEARQAFWTLPALMQLVQTLRRFVEPFTEARTRWMFGFQRRFVRRCECDTDMPHDGPLPHTSQTDAI